jgi:hypothetical protein
MLLLIMKGTAEVDLKKLFQINCSLMNIKQNNGGGIINVFT